MSWSTSGAGEIPPQSVSKPAAGTQLGILDKFSKAVLVQFDSPQGG